MDSALIDYIERHYFFELDRKDRLNRSVSVPLGISALVATLIGFSVDFPINASAGSIFCWILIVFSCECLVVFYIVSALFFAGPGYKYVVDIEEFLKHREAVATHHKNYQIEGSVKGVLQEQIANSMARSTNHNRIENDRKSTHLYYMNVSIFLGLGFASIAAASYSVYKLN